MTITLGNPAILKGDTDIIDGDCYAVYDVLYNGEYVGKLKYTCSPNYSGSFTYEYELYDVKSDKNYTLFHTDYFRDKKPAKDLNAVIKKIEFMYLYDELKGKNNEK